MVRRSRGDRVSDAEITGAHADLMPELAKELSLLGVLERAKDSATGQSRTGRRAEVAIEPLGEDAFAGFRVVGELRRGGQGVVFDAVQSSTGRRVAIKMMREGHFAGDRDAARFEREVRILGQLDHPGVVGILASGIRGGHFYYVMDFVDGAPLDQFAASIGRRPMEVLRAIEKVADAVNAAHLRGIIHRDLKPGNILVDNAGQPHILDFGLARIVSEGDTRMTATGQFVGSMPWASPEQASGNQAKIDLRTDVYSLGVILYHALTGRFPYEVDTGPRDALDNILNASPARPRSISGAIDAGAEAITLKCLRKDPGQRYQSAGDLAADIRRYLAGRPVLAHPPSFWYQARSIAARNRALVAGAAAVLLALVLGLVGTSAGLVQASAARATAVHERDEAQRHAYAASIAAADSALRVDDSGTAKTQLRSAPEALRGWEWRYLAARADQSEETFRLRAWDAKVVPDGSGVLVIRRDQQISLTDLKGENAKWTQPLPDGIEVENDHQFVVGYSRDGRLAATQHLTSVLVWNLADGTLVQRLMLGGNWGYVTASFSPDGKTVLTSGRESYLRVWDLASGTSTGGCSLGSPFSSGADYAPDGSTIAASVIAGIRILDAKSLETIREIKVASPPRPDWGYIRYTPDGRWIIACQGASIVAIDPEGKRAPIEFRGGSQVLLPFGLSADGTRIAAGSWDCAVRVWNLETGALEVTLVGHEERVMSAGFAGDRVVSTGGEGLVKVWEPRPSPGVKIVPRSLRHHIMPSGESAVVYGVEGFRMVDLGSGRTQDLAMPRVGFLWAAAVSPDGRVLLNSDGKSRLSAWKIPEGTLVWSSDSQRGAIGSTRLSNDGRQIATLHIDGYVEFRDAATGIVTGAVQVPKETNCWVVFHPNRPEASVSGYWGSFIVIDTHTLAKRIIDYPKKYGHSLVVQVAYSPDGSLLATCDGNGGVLIWNTASWEVVTRLSGMRPTAWAAAFSPDGERLAVGSQDRMIHIFETRHWREMLILRGHTGTVGFLEWTPDARRLVSSSNDSTTRIWDAGPAAWDASN